MDIYRKETTKIYYFAIMTYITINATVNGHLAIYQLSHPVTPSSSNHVRNAQPYMHIRPETVITFELVYRTREV